MFFLRQPSSKAIQKFISSQGELPFSYPEIGATAGELPQGYTVDRNRIKLGKGKETYERAIWALREWKQFDLGWVRMVPPDTPIEVGAVVAILTRHFGFWSLNACRQSLLNIRLESRVPPVLRISSLHTTHLAKVRFCGSQLPQ